MMATLTASLSTTSISQIQSGQSLIPEIESNLDLDAKFLRYLNQSLSPEETVGKLDFHTGEVPLWRTVIGSFRKTP